MATTTFTDFNISDTYLGILHAKGEGLPATGQQYIYDGEGNPSDMKLGRNGQGVSFNGALSAQSGKFISLSSTTLNCTTIVGTTLSINGLKYPTAPGSLNHVVLQGANNQLVMSEKIPQGAIPDLIPNPAGIYSDIGTVTVNSAGQVTNITQAPASGSLTVTSTTYISDVSSPYHITTPGPSYGSALNFPDVPDDAKTLILYVGPRNSQEAQIGKYQIYASRDGTQSREWPVSFAGGGETSGDRTVPYLDGTQFITRCEDRPSGSGVRVYLRAISNTLTSPVTHTLEVYLIGYQQ